MTQYVCVQLSTSVPQACDSWIESASIIETFAITSTQAAQLCAAIASYFVVCYILKLLRSSVK